MELAIAKNMLASSIEAEVIFQILIEKGVCTSEEVKKMRAVVKEIPDYKEIASSIKEQEEKRKELEDDPMGWILDLAGVK